MIKYLFLFTTWFLFYMSVSGQSPSSHFVLNGKINIDTGKAYLLAVSGDTSYYPTERIFDKTTISKGEFVIQGLCPQPSMFLLCVEVESVPKYKSDYFIVAPGAQNITCNVDSIWEIPKIGNKYTDELKNEYLPAFEVARGKAKPENERSRFFFNYASVHPTSVIILWELINELTSKGYEPVLDSAYHSLSVAIRSSFAGKALASKMATMRRLAVGASFPELSLLDTNMNNVKIDFSSRQVKYVLVDFWYSHCGPCLSEFEELKKIYKQYEPYGFAIAGVSVDGKKFIQDWKKVIQDYKLPWPQYLDMGGYQASNLMIRAFPQKFLLDSQGKILKRDPDLKSLSSFLKENIH
jgi:peroxiredoxin